MADMADIGDIGKSNYKYTHGEFWGGTVLPYWIFLILTVFPLTGFFGIDHLAFKSPSTAALKGLTNIFTLGFWYFYDIIQAFTDKNYIRDFGLSLPTGPAGLAFRYFSNIDSSKRDVLDSSSVTGISSVLIFILYLFTLLLPFGISHLIGGDSNAGLIQFIMSFGVIWIPFFWFGGLYETYRALFKTESIFKDGSSRILPLTLFMDSRGYAPRIMDPKSVSEVEKTVSTGAANASVFSFFLKPIMKILGFPDPVEMFDTAKCSIVPPIQKTVEAVGVATNGVKNLIEEVPAIANKAKNTMKAFTDPVALAGLLNKKQTGGYGLTESSFDNILIGGVLLIVFGGLFAGFLRSSIKKGKNNENDSPPDPRSVRNSSWETKTDNE